MKRNRFLSTTIFCLITLLLIVQVANAETIIPLFDNRLDPPPWSIMMVPNRAGDHINNINVDLLYFSTGRTLRELAFLEEPTLPEINGNQWAVGPLAASPGELVGATSDITTSLYNMDFSADALEFGNTNKILNDLGFAEEDEDIDHHTVYARMNIKNHHTEDIGANLHVVVHGNTSAKVWLNDSEILNYIAATGNDISGTAAGITLVPGDNDLLFKSSHALGEWNVLPFLLVGDDGLAAEIEPVAIQGGSTTQTAEDTETPAGGDIVLNVRRPVALQSGITLNDTNNNVVKKWTLDDQFTDIAVTQNATYFVWKPDVPEVLRGMNDIPYQSNIALDISRHDDDRALEGIEDIDELEAAGKLPSEYPYFIVPLAENPMKEYKAAGEIFTWWKVAKNLVTELTKQAIEDAVDFVIDLIPQPWSLVVDAVISRSKVYYSVFVDARDLIAEENVAKNVILDALKDPSEVIEDYSVFGFESSDSDHRKPRYLVMIPEKLDAITIRTKTHYFTQDVDVSPTTLTIMKNEGARGFFKGNLDLFWDAGERHIRLHLPDDAEVDGEEVGKSVETLFEYWKSTGTRWFQWPGEWNANDASQLDNSTKADIKTQFTYFLTLWDQLFFPISQTEINSFTTWDQESEVHPILKLELPYLKSIHEGVEANYTLQLRSAAAAAPYARDMSLADYPPFQELAPEVQALLLDHFGDQKHRELDASERHPLPEETALLPNYPNPFNPETWIPYQLAQPADVALKIYDIQGHVVRDLDLGHQRAGMYHSQARAAYWDGKNAVGEPVASGVYFYTFTAGDFTATRKMLIRK
ncbi:MAG: T9SS type A sorting domain-containing protein [Candidatus Poribacteria bacterium]|nr:T9SS type A sorting domain-containing protein [Candidatus Poribacteria bacterium]